MPGRPLPERQKSETVGQRRQLQADTTLQKEVQVKTRKRKKAGVFESCRAGWFEGHVMRLLSSGSKTKATLSPSLSVSLHVDSACLFLFERILRNHIEHVFNFSSPQGRAPHPGINITNALRNVCKCKACLLRTDTKDHLWLKVHIRNLVEA